MKKHVVMIMLLGVLTKVETVTYQDGTVVERIYNNPQDVIPSDIKWVKSPKPLSPDKIIEHREVELYNFWMK